MRNSANATFRRPAGFIEPCIPTVADRPPIGPGWCFEIKYDGYRLEVWRDGERVRLFTRRGFDWTERYPWIVQAARRLPVARFLIDGEVVVSGEDGVADFARLHARADDASAFLYGFDLLALDGADIRGERLDARRAKLAQLLANPDGIRFSENLDGDGAVIFRHACKLGLEGIVCKRRDSTYQSGRSKTWLKVKNLAAPGVTRFEKDA
jgi:bifunctional non-homologous end joining protein LigD